MLRLHVAKSNVFISIAGLIKSFCIFGCNLPLRNDGEWINVNPLNLKDHHGTAGWLSGNDLLMDKAVA
jgi:hypothetical protein